MRLTSVSRCRFRAVSAALVAVCGFFFLAGMMSGCTDEGAPPTALVATPAPSLEAAAVTDSEPTYRSPVAVAFGPEGAQLAVADRTAALLYLLDTGAGHVAREVTLRGKPTGVAWGPDGNVLVAEYDAGTIAAVEPKSGRVIRRIQVGPKPWGVAVAPQRGMLLVTDHGLGVLSFLDIETGREEHRVAGLHFPCFVDIAPDESVAVVGDLLPKGPATDVSSSSAVTVVDLDSGTATRRVRLPDGSTNVRQLAISPDGRWAYVVHTRGRVALPTTQLERGWVNTNVLSIIDLQAGSYYTSVLLDRVTKGAADPWGIALSSAGETAWIALAGVHQVARVDLGRLHPLMEGAVDLDDPEAYTGSALMVWNKVREAPSRRAELLPNHLSALYGMDLMERRAVPVQGPRGVDVSPDGRIVALAGYYSGKVLLLDADTGEVRTVVDLGEQPEPDLVRRGEMRFHDGTACFQNWLSCVSCHPHGRADGLNWDLLNDGIGNPKNARSMLVADRTPPVMSRAVRDDYTVAINAGFRYIQFHQPETGDEKAVAAYIRSLEPEVSPHLVAGELSPLARRGKEIFESDSTGCARCHPGALFTDLKSYDVGTRHELDRSGTFDNPTLLELWRTPPYLHDGSALTLRDVVTTLNPNDEHGRTSHLDEDDIDALVAYLKSL